ncbi:hypothetical protein BDZ97DRAFT_1831243, partial [Flammula alnicola]
DSAVLQPQIHSVNAKKRSGSEVAEDMRDAKKAKVDSESLPLSVNGKEKDKKRKKKKKKRRTSVVIPGPEHRERASSKPRSAVATFSPIKSKSSEPTVNGTAEKQEEDEPMLSSSDKGKGKAKSESPPRRASIPPIQPAQPVASGSRPPVMSDQASEIARLKEKLAAQTALLERHQTHFVHHQQSLTCQICLDLMHKPYALAPCGHTTCYGAGGANANPPEAQGDGIDAILNSAVARHGAFIRRRKNCPVCRAVVTDRPIEMWGIKSMVAALVRTGLADLPVPVLPPPEENAPNNNGNNDPWRNVFRRAGAPNARHMGPGFHGYFMQPPPLPVPPQGEGDREQMGWYDAEDGGIYRCTDCYHEIWDGICSYCHRQYPGHGHVDDDDDDDDDESAFGGDGHLQRFMDALMHDEGEDEDEEDLDEEELQARREVFWHLRQMREEQDEEDMLDDAHNWVGPGPRYGPHRHLIQEDGQDLTDSEGEGDDLLEYDDHLGNHPHPQHFAQMLFGNHRRDRQNRHPGGGVAMIEEVGAEEEEEEEEDYEGSFIDDDGEGEDHGSDEEVEIVDDDDDDDDLEIVDRPPARPRSRARAQLRRRADVFLSSDEDADIHDIEDPRAVARQLGRSTRLGGAPERRAAPFEPPRRRVHVIVDDDDDDDLEAEEVSDAEIIPARGRGVRRRAPAIPHQLFDDEEEEDDS